MSLEARLRQLPREEEPPADLENRIALELRRTYRSPRGSQRWMLAAVVAVAAFGLGFVTGRPRAAAASPDAPMFAMLLRESQNTLVGDRVAEYTNWAHSEAKRGHLVNGEKLADQGRLVRAGSNAATDFVRPGEIGGFFVITADNLESATRIAATCPHLKYGGTIELREIVRH